MSVDRARLLRRTWVRAVVAHARAAESHETAAELFASLNDESLATRESELASTERQRFADALERHPEWAEEVEELVVSLAAGRAARERVASPVGSA